MKRWIGVLILIVISAALVAALACYPGVSDDTTERTPAADDTTEQTPASDDATEQAEAAKQAALAEAEAVFDAIRNAKIAGCVGEDGVDHSGILEDITYFSVDTTDNVVHVLIWQLNEDKIAAFKKAFPDAKCVIFEQGYRNPSRAILTDESKIAKNLSAEISQLDGDILHCTIKNTSKSYSYYWEYYYYLDRYLEGVQGLEDGWYTVPAIPTLIKGNLGDGVVAVPAIGYVPLSPGDSRYPIVSLGNKYGKLPAGRYRMVITMEVLPEHDKYDDYAPSYTIGLEFEIKAEQTPVATVPSDTTGTLKAQLIEATPTSITYTLENISPGYVYDYGSPFSVQQKIDGEWYSVPELPLPDGVHRGWTMEAYNLRAGKTRERTENWGGLYGSLPKGQYRLIKGLDVYYSESVYDNPRLPLYKLVDEHYTVAIEFTIE